MIRPAARTRLLSLISLTLGNSLLAAQAPTPPAQPESRASIAERTAQAPIQTIYLHNIANQNDANEIMTALRNTVRPDDHIYLVPSRNAIVIRALPDDVALAQRLVTELDSPKQLYKLTYTIAEMDGTSRIGVQHFDVVVLAGQKVILKQGNRVPVVASSTADGKGPTNQVVYLDVGINIDSEIVQGGNHVTLKTKVERSSVADTTTALGSQDPVIRQTLIEGEVNLEEGKPLIIGSMDVVGSTRHVDVDVVAHTIP